MKNKEQEKEKNNRKRQLLLALFMLIVSSITLTTASYAWFTANTNVSIETLDVNVGASNGIQISTDAVNWKAAITKDDILTKAYSGHQNQVPASISPTSSAGNISTATDTTAGTVKGHMEIFSGGIEWDEEEADYMLTAPELLKDAPGTNGQYIAFDVFFLVQQETDLYLTTGSSVLPKATSTTTTDTGLKNAARVAFLYEGNVAAGNSASAIALDGATDSIIWEPNYNTHTSAAVDWNTTVYGTTISTTSEVSYDGVKAVISDENAIPHGSTSSEAPGSTYLQSVTPEIQTEATMAAYEEVMTLPVGISKVRIYAWVEGQDIDCENNASGSDISFTLKFSKNSSAS